MRSTFHGLETAKRGLFAQQTAIKTTGHNISNANTEGYTRQTVDFVASRAIEVPGITKSKAPGQLGTGVDFSTINRLRESFLDDQFRNQYKSLGDWTVRRDTLEKIEAMVNEPSSDGLRSVFDKFWNGWQDLSNQPDSLTARTVVIENALALTDTVNDIASKLVDLKNDINESIKIKVTDVNVLTSQIAKLNEEIYRIESLGDHANDMRDQRDLLTDQLSKLMNITVTQTSKGYTITTGNTELVNGKEYSPVDANSLPAGLNSGELNGYLESIKNVDAFKAQLDQMVKGLVEGEFNLTVPAGTILPEGTTLIQADGTPITFSGDIAARTAQNDLTIKVKGINGLHQLGYTMQEPAKGGGLFFTTKDGSNNYVAGNIQLNSEILNDGRNIAASTKVYAVTTATGDVEKVVKGNNELALWIAQMRHGNITFENNGGEGIIEGEGTIDEAFRAMVGRLGVKTKEAIRQVDNNTILVEQVDTRRQSVSGVSLDEEMANLVKFQHAYNASARMITAIDEMLDKIINGMGIVGR